MTISITQTVEIPRLFEHSRKIPVIVQRTEMLNEAKILRPRPEL